MQFTTYILATFALISAALATPVGGLVERDLLQCGSQQYDPKNYTCYADDNNLLCPISNGVIFQPCGPACFDPANYTCINGQLAPVGNCNGQVFDKNSYVCVNNHLCPVGFPNLCGEACYSLSQYHCVNGQLVQN
ncbi:carbohydrate binding-domain-containing protein [Tuber borchii]|uniref:Carbohydrate binding-domain-containing protein n=1 Tax=Tuber borchii TaxID=42251 RepID=A0A2T6ZK65_TUBBO|nr:carbohydrate binding-domain-containing protein [Tuber borchii]